MPVPERQPDRNSFSVLARVRRALRALNDSIERGARTVGLTVQQQAFVLAIAAAGDGAVPLAALREELRMDQATASELLARLVSRGYVERDAARDRRAAQLSLTQKGRAVLFRSIRAIRREIQHADARGELDALRESIDDYLRFYLRLRRRARTSRRRTNAS